MVYQSIGQSLCGKFIFKQVCVYINRACFCSFFVFFFSISNALLQSWSLVPTPDLIWIDSASHADLFWKVQCLSMYYLLCHFAFTGCPRNGDVVNECLNYQVDNQREAEICNFEFGRGLNNQSHLQIYFEPDQWPSD